MLQLTSKSLKKRLQFFLANLQKEIDNQPNFTSQAKKASKIWTLKRQTKDIKKIQKQLIKMNVGRQLCNYCETSIAVTIEHIYPKKIFPNMTFKWENLLSACYDCNRRKNDQFEVFNPVNSSTRINVTPPRGTFLASPTEDAVLINPRVENPLNFLELDLLAQTFTFLPVGNSQRSLARGSYTVECLQLDSEKLCKERRAATKHYIGLLHEYVQVKKSTNFEELEAAIKDLPYLDSTIPFDKEKSRVMKVYKKWIIKDKHPTVWKELQRQSQEPKLAAKFTKTVGLFTEAPEALTW